MNQTHHRVSQSLTELKSLLKRRINADFRKGKQMYDKELQSFNLRLSAFYQISSTLWNSVFCGKIHSEQFGI